VIGIGGGSALDAAKAIAGLLEVRRSVMDFLEGVGPELPYEGPAVPLIAVPTTAGTGSEATKNAVLSRQGPDGFKKSFRHERLVPEYALVDPELLRECPRTVIAANGMDALTQLIEAFVSLRSNRFTDGLVWAGLEAARDGLLTWYERGAEAHEAQARMAYAAMVSGVALAQTGLGSVHGLASPLGAFYPIPHGAACGTLVAEATRTNIDAMLAREPDNPALDKYARLAQLLCHQHFSHREPAWQALVDLLTEWTERLDLPRLGSFGLGPENLDPVVANSRGSSMKTNPIILTDAEIRQLVERRL
jgi:alcohol dehydrogenase